MSPTAMNIIEWTYRVTVFLILSPVIIPAVIVTVLIAGRDALSIEGGITAGFVFAGAAFGITMLYLGLLIGSLV